MEVGRSAYLEKRRKGREGTSVSRLWWVRAKGGGVSRRAGGREGMGHSPPPRSLPPFFCSRRYLASSNSPSSSSLSHPLSLLVLSSPPPRVSCPRSRTARRRLPQPSPRESVRPSVVVHCRRRCLLTVLVVVVCSQTSSSSANRRGCIARAAFVVCACGVCAVADG